MTLTHHYAKKQIKHRVLQYFSLYDTYDTSWTTFLEQQNIKHIYNPIGSRINLATPSQKEIGRQIEYYRKKLRIDPGYCKLELETYGFNKMAGIPLKETTPSSPPPPTIHCLDDKETIALSPPPPPSSTTPS